MSTRLATHLIMLIMVLLASARAGADCAVLPSEQWKLTVAFPTDRFIVAPASPAEPASVKVTVLLCDPFNAFFQDGHTLPTHYDFGSQFIQPVVGVTPKEYDQFTLYVATQEFMIGSVVYPPTSGTPGAINEIGIQLIRHDPLTVAEIVEHFELIRSSVTGTPAPAAFYFPTPEQLPSAQANRRALAAAGIHISSIARWIDDCNANGVPDDSEAFCPSDLDGNCAVDVDDLIAVIVTWGTDGSAGGDVTADGVVDCDDLVAVIMGFGACR